MGKPTRNHQAHRDQQRSHQHGLASHLGHETHRPDIPRMDGMESSQASLQQHHGRPMENATSSFISWAQPSQPPSLQELFLTNCRTSRAATSKECPQSSKGTSSHNISQSYWEIAHPAVPGHQRQHLTQQNALQEHQDQRREERMDHRNRRERWREHQQAHRWTTPSRAS